MTADPIAAYLRAAGTSPEQLSGFQPIAPDASLADVFSQVTELWQVYENTTKDLKLSELSDLRERKGHIPRQRDVLTDSDKLRRKLEIETGVGRDGVTRTPLEPWTGPAGSMRLYHQIMHGVRVTVSGALPPASREALHWMASEQLIAVGDDGAVLPLSDGRAPAQRAYPGATATDKRAGIGLTLRGHATGLVLAALANISAGRPVRRSRRRKRAEALTADGVPVTAAAVCAEANRIRKRRPDLQEHRWLSLSVCRRVIRDLIHAGVIEEITSPKPVRRERSWRTLPRVIRRVTRELLEKLRPPSALAPA